MESSSKAKTSHINVLLLIYYKMQLVSNAIKRQQSMVVSIKFYENVKHILFVNRIIGIFPITVKRNKDTYVLKWSWFKVIISSFCFILFTILTIAGLILSYSIETVYNIRLKTLAARIVTLAEIFTMLSTWIVGQICIPILFQNFWHYLLCLKECDDIIGSIEISKKITIVITLVFSFTFTCLGMDIYMWSLISVPLIGVPDFIWKMVPFYFTYVFTMLMELNYWISVYGITVRTKSLNKLIKTYIVTGQSEEGKEYHNMFNNFNIIRVESKVDSTKKNLATKSTFLPPETIKSFIDAYNNIYEANIAANNFFGVIITIILFSTIVTLVITPYVLYQQILNSESNSFIFTQSYWMTCHILRLMFIIEPCENGQRQGAEIRRAAVKLLHLNLPENSLIQARTFWVTVMENNIKFSASGMTVINRSILPTIGGAVFTYLAILFQYHANA